jgi:hypothetical protein
MKHQHVKKIFLQTLFFVTVSALIMSCGGDDDDGAKSVTLSFTQSSLNVNEDAGKIYVKLELNKAFSKDITIRLETEGTAIETTDYTFEDDIRRIKILKGQTEVEVGINIIKDNNFEQPETLTLKIGNVDNKSVQIGQNKVDITITDTGVAPVVNFKNTTMVLDEGIDSKDLTRIELTLDKSVGFDVIVEYKIDGNALDSMYLHRIGESTFYSDFYVNGPVELKGEYTYGKVTIPAGSTSGFIELQIYSDLFLEDDEIIALTLESASGGITIGSNKTIEIDLYQEDGKVIALTWGPGNAVDMDLFFWAVNQNNQPTGFIHLEAAVSKNDADTIEAFIVPKWFPQGKYGLSHIYYEGTADPLNFKSLFVDLVDGQLVFESRQIFNGVYAITDQFKWDEKDEIPPIVQTFNIENGIIQNISEIALPEAPNSRLKSPTFSNRNINKMHRGTLQFKKNNLNSRIKSSIQRAKKI